MFGALARRRAARTRRCWSRPRSALSLQGRDIEEVLLLRDETANLAWAVERTVEGEHGRPVDRAQAAYEAVPDAAPPPAGRRRSRTA